jgi:hypothetical protein
MNLLIVPTLFVLIYTLYTLYESLQYKRHIRRLDDSTPLKIGKLPLVSIIIPARNEEQHIETALASVLALEYPRLEIIVLDDRSTDGTAEILHRMSEQDPRLRVITLRNLPSGWLGKNHALHVGAEQADGEFFLFTDADVRMAPDTVSRAVNRMLEQDLEHLCLIFRLDLPNALLAMLVADSLSGLLFFFKPWRVSEPDSPYFIGVGGFNLVRQKAYTRIGGHRPIRLCPVDDMLLGRLIKKAGGKQECLDGCKFITVPWYGSIAEMANGLRKNAFSFVDYKLSFAIPATLLGICCQILPFWGFIFTAGIVRLLCALTVISLFFVQYIAVRAVALPLGCLRWFLVAPYVKLWIFWRAIIITLRHGGIDWRGTFYPLDELKQNMISLLPWKK